MEFKLQYCNAIQLRVEELIKIGRNIILVGDVNVCLSEIDHCNPQESMKENNVDHFGDTPSRQWLSSFLEPQGQMVDAFRKFHANETGQFTVWNTLKNARYTLL